MVLRLEHANFNVRDIDAMIRFLQTAFPEFRIRFEGTDSNGQRWVHVGTEETYIALNPATEQTEDRSTPYDDIPGVNHLGFEVEDADALRDRLKTAGYQESTPPNAHPFRKRVYFYDPDGNDWEFVQYLSDDLSQRHDYELPDV
jgi:catechol 2,3-dioxygenase-like lactoylglutathione lyase family enzyme